MDSAWTEGLSVETLCVKCFNNGTTRFLMTPIHRFRDILVSSFECPHCGFANREVQSGLALADSGGSRYTLHVTTPEDLNRQIIKGTHGKIVIPDIDFEIPPTTQQSACSTVEGILRRSVEGLECSLEYQDPQRLPVIQDVICSLTSFASAEKLPFTFILEDPAGHSFIEPLDCDEKDPRLTVEYFPRTEEHLHAMGYYAPQAPYSEPLAMNPSSDASRPDLDRSKEISETSLANQLKSESRAMNPSSEASRPDLDRSKEISETSLPNQLKSESRGMNPSSEASRPDLDRSKEISETSLANQLKSESRAMNPSSGAARPGLDRCMKISEKTLPTQLKLAGWDLSQSLEDNLLAVSTSQIKNSLDQSQDSPLRQECLRLPVQCPHCGADGFNEMCEINIPGFKTCLIMAFLCIQCGCRSHEVKPMAAYGEQGRKWTLHVCHREDLNRDVLKSDTAALSIPQVDLSMCMGCLGGFFTTVEGVVVKILENLSEQRAIFLGDSAEESKRQTFQNLLHKLRQFIDDPETYPFDLCLDDPADLSMISHRSSFVSAPFLHSHALDPVPADHQDPFLSVETYDRSVEQNDDLGLTDMRVEHYE